jgi:hypothetical protein
MGDNIRVEHLKKQDVRIWTGFNWLKMGIVVGSREHGNEPSSATKGGEFFDRLRDYQLFKKSSVPCS